MPTRQRRRLTTRALLRIITIPVALVTIPATATAITIVTIPATATISGAIPVTATTTTIVTILAIATTPAATTIILVTITTIATNILATLTDARIPAAMAATDTIADMDITVTTPATTVRE